jgi:hypothetical protein
VGVRIGFTIFGPVRIYAAFFFAQVFTGLAFQEIIPFNRIRLNKLLNKFFF